MLFKSPAKINISLKITGLDENGYHLLEMVNLPLEIHDVVEIDKIPGGETYVTCDDPHLTSVKENLCFTAYNAMRDAFDVKDNYMVSIHKEIPFAAGLGGGSSNAATVIKAVNKLSHLRKKNDELAKIGLSIGADVPFFFDPKPTLVRGIGEKMDPFKIRRPFFVLLVKPTQGLSTKAIYAICDNFKRKPINTEKVIEGIKNHDFKMVMENSGNDLLDAAESLCPEVKNVLDGLKECGFDCYGMTGSGSCCYALTDNVKLLRLAGKKMEAKGYIVKLTKSLSSF